MKVIFNLLNFPPLPPPSKRHCICGGWGGILLLSSTLGSRATDCGEVVCYREACPSLQNYYAAVCEWVGNV